jgi:DNA-binding NarL/FixJ family response regulator
VLIADGETSSIAEMQQAFHSVPAIAVVGQAADLQSLQDQVAALYPEGLDLVLLDLNLPPIGGVLAAATLLAAYPDLQVVVMGHPLDEWDRLAARRVGAASYLSKQMKPAALVATLLGYRRGESASPPPAESG